MAIIIIQHDEDKPGARINAVLRDHAFRLDIRQLHAGDQLPTDFDEVDAVVSLPSDANVGENHAWMGREIDFIREAHARQLPIVGVCFGHQLVAHALGGSVGAMEQPEAGFAMIDLTPMAHTDTVLTGIPWRSPQFSWHSQEVTELPPGATPLATSDKCRIQAFKAGLRTYGFQFHFEADAPIVDRFIGNHQSTLHRSGMTTDEFSKQRRERELMFARCADRLCVNIAAFLIPRVANAITI